MSSNKQIRNGAILSYISITINILSGLVYTPWMVSRIGQSQFGLYTLANSIISLFLLDLGLGLATSRYISKYRAEGNQEKIDFFLGSIYKIYAALSGVLLVFFSVFFFCIDYVYTQLTVEEIRQFRVVYCISAGFSVINFPFVTFDGILSSYEKFIPLKLTEIAYRILYIATTSVALLLNHGLYVFVGLHAVVGLAITLAKGIIIKRTLPIRICFHKQDNRLYREIFSFSLWVSITSLAQRLIFNLMPSILGVVASSSAIAVFGIVTTIESYAYTVIAAIKGLFMPRVSELLLKDEKGLGSLNLSVGKFLYGLNGLIIVGFTILGKDFLLLWMGPEYADAYAGILLVLIPGLFYNSLQIANTTIIATKKVDLQAYVTVGTGVINVILAFPLSYRYGVIGSCLAIFIAYIARAIALNIMYHKVLPFDMLEFSKECYLKMSIPIVVAVLCCAPLHDVSISSDWLGLIIKGILVSAIYFVSIFVLGMSKVDRKAALKFIHTAFVRK